MSDDDKAKLLKSRRVTNREILGDEHYLLILQDYENLRAKSKAFKGKPDAYDRLEMKMNKMFEKHYKVFLD